MKLIDWSEWLDKHIPYYEADKLRNRFSLRPPVCVLVVTVQDRNRTTQSRHSMSWEQINTKIFSAADGQCSPIFLTSDTAQLWLWVFWDQAVALFTMMQL